MDHAPHQPLLATADATLAEELTRLSAAAGRRGRRRLDRGRGAERVEHRAGGARRRRPRAGAGRAGAAPQARRPGRRVVAGAGGSVPRRAARRRRAGRRAARRCRAGRRAAHRPRGGRPRRGRSWSASWAGPAAPERRRWPARSARSRPPVGRRWWSTSTRWGRGATGCSPSTTRPACGGTRSARRPGRLSGRSLREAVPRRDGAGRAGVGLRSVGARRRRRARGAVGGAPRPRHGGRRPPALGRPRGRDGRAVRAWSCWSSCRRSPVWPPRPGGWPRFPTPAGSGCWSVVAAPTRDGSPRSSAPRCSRRWPTSAGWPRRSTWGWVRCGRVAGRSPPRPVELLAGLTPAALAA